VAIFLSVRSPPLVPMPSYFFLAAFFLPAFFLDDFFALAAIWISMSG
jgi:hypothetical protein